MAAPTPISCDVHDHLEVACLFRYELELTTNRGAKIVGRATTTRTDSDKSEYLILDTPAGPVDIPMHDILTVTVLTSGARFASLRLGESNDDLPG